MRELSQAEFHDAVDSELPQLSDFARNLIKALDSGFRILQPTSLVERQRVKPDSKVVQNLTGWEYFLNTGIDHESTNVIYALEHKDVRAITNNHLARVIIKMTDFMQSRKEFENQPFNVEFDMGIGETDKRVPRDEEKYGASRFVIINEQGQASMIDVSKTDYEKHAKDGTLNDLAELMAARMELTHQKKLPLKDAQKAFKHVQFVINKMPASTRGSVWQENPFDSAWGTLYIGVNDVEQKVDTDNPAEVIGVLNHKIADGGPGIRFFLDSMNDVLPDKAARVETLQPGEQAPVKLLTPEGEKKPICSIDIPSSQGAINTLFQTFVDTLDDELGPGAKTILVPVARRIVDRAADMEMQMGEVEVNYSPQGEKQGLSWGAKVLHDVRKAFTSNTRPIKEGKAPIVVDEVKEEVVVYEGRRERVRVSTEEMRQVVEANKMRSPDMESRIEIAAVVTEVDGQRIDKNRLKSYLSEAAAGGGYLSGVFTSLFANDRVPLWARHIALPFMKVVAPEIARASEGDATLTKAIHLVYSQEEFDQLIAPSFTTLNPTGNVDRVTLAVTEVQLVDPNEPNRVLKRKYGATVAGGGKYVKEDNLRRFAQKLQDKLHELAAIANQQQPAQAMAMAA